MGGQDDVSIGPRKDPVHADEPSSPSGDTGTEAEKQNKDLTDREALLAQLREADEGLKERKARLKEQLQILQDKGKCEPMTVKVDESHLSHVKEQTKVPSAPSGETTGSRILARLRERMEAANREGNAETQKESGGDGANSPPASRGVDVCEMLGPSDVEIKPVEEEDALAEDDKTRLIDQPEEKREGIRYKVWMTVDDPNYSNISFSIAMYMFALIIISTLAFVLETVHDLYDILPWFSIETFCVSFFAIEYAFRFLICPKYWYLDNSSFFTRLRPKNRLNNFLTAELFARARFVLQPNNIVDLVAILPTLIEWVAADTLLKAYAGALVDLRAIRLTRLFRLLRLIGYSEGQMMRLISETMVMSWRMLRTLMFFWAIAVLVFSSIVYYAERGTFFFCSAEAAEAGLCPAEDARNTLSNEGYGGLEECAAWAGRTSTLEEKMLQCCYGEAWYSDPPMDSNGDGCADLSKFATIPSTFWFVVATMTTVGYGDYVPVTSTGKIVSMVAAFGGILTLALPTTVISHDFGIVCKRVDEEEEKKEEEIREQEKKEKEMKDKERREQEMKNNAEATAKLAAERLTRSSSLNNLSKASRHSPVAGRSNGVQTPLGSPALLSRSLDEEIEELGEDGEKKKPPPKSLRDKMWMTLDDPNFSTIAYISALTVSVMIVLSTIAFVLETVPELYHFLAWKDIEFVCVAAFACEYFSRLFICPTHVYLDVNSYFIWLKPEKHDTDRMVAEILARGRFVLQPMNIIDILAIFPVIIEWYVASTMLRSSAGALVDLRAIRLTRVFRLFKMMKYVEGMQLISKTLSRSWRMLRSLFFLLMVVVLVCASVMYFAERGKFFFCSKAAANHDMCRSSEVREMAKEGYSGLEECNSWANARVKATHEQVLMCCYGPAWYANPPMDANGDGCADQSLFTSIPNTFWFVVATMTTVGYGDYVPITLAGKLLAMLTALCGILILALPITVITHNFEVECIKQNEEKVRREKEAAARAEARRRRLLLGLNGGDDPHGAKPSTSKALWSSLRAAMLVSSNTGSFRRTISTVSIKAPSFSGDSRRRSSASTKASADALNLKPEGPLSAGSACEVPHSHVQGEGVVASSSSPQAATGQAGKVFDSKVDSGKLEDVESKEKKEGYHAKAEEGEGKVGNDGGGSRVVGGDAKEEPDRGGGRKGQANGQQSEVDGAEVKEKEEKKGAKNEAVESAQSSSPKTPKPFKAKAIKADTNGKVEAEGKVDSEEEKRKGNEKDAAEETASS